MKGNIPKNAVLPSKGNIKDDLLKMILYSNLSEVTVNEKETVSEAVLCLTSSKLKGAISSASEANEVNEFFAENKLSNSQKELIQTVFAEANQNNFVVKVQFSK